MAAAGAVINIDNNITVLFNKEQLEKICLQLIRHLRDETGKYSPSCWSELVFYMGNNSQDTDFEGLMFSHEQFIEIIDRLSQLDPEKFGEYKCPKEFKISKKCSCDKN